MDLSDQRYYYDSETCSFVEVERTWTDVLAYAGQILGLAVVLTGLVVWAMDAYWLKTPEEEALRVENKALEQQLDRVGGRMTMISSKLDTLEQRDERLYRRLFQIEPISNDVRQVGVGGTDPYKEFDRMDEGTASLLKSTAQKLDKLERQMSLQSTSYRELARVAQDRSTRLSQLPAIRPANGPIVSGYGMRYHPILKVRKMHEGVDFLLRVGTPVMATGSGVVEEATQIPSYGKHIEIRHPEAEYTTLYAHLSEIPDTIAPGARVERGDLIGYSGNTGRSTGPHLHYEVHDRNDRTLDPMHFFVPDMSPEDYHQLEERTHRYQARFAQAPSTAEPSSVGR